MGSYKQGILGPFSGKVGTVVGSFWRGIYYMRALAPHVTNPQTEDQVKVRSIFSLASRSLRPFVVPIRAGYRQLMENSPWAAAVSENYKVIAAASSESVPLVFPWADLILTNGSIPFDVQVAPGRNSEYECVWAPVDASSPFDGGWVYVVAFGSLKNQVETFRANMSAGSIAINAAAIEVNEANPLRIWTFAAGTDEASVANLYTATT